MQLDDIGFVDLTDESACAAFVNPEHWFEVVKRTLVKNQCIVDELSNRCPLASLVNCIRVADSE